MTRTQYYRELVRDLVEGNIAKTKVIAELVHIIHNLLSSHSQKLRFTISFNNVTIHNMQEVTIPKDHVPVTGFITAQKADGTPGAVKEPISYSTSDPSKATIEKDASDPLRFTVTLVSAGDVEIVATGDAGLGSNSHLIESRALFHITETEGEEATEFVFTFENV